MGKQETSATENRHHLHHPPPQPNNASNRDKINKSTMSDKFPITHIAPNQNKDDSATQNPNTSHYSEILYPWFDTPPQTANIHANSNSKLHCYLVVARMQCFYVGLTNSNRACNSNSRALQQSAVGHIEPRTKYLQAARKCPNFMRLNRPCSGRRQCM